MSKLNALIGLYSSVDATSEAEFFRRASSQEFQKAISLGDKAYHQLADVAGQVVQHRLFQFQTRDRWKHLLSSAPDADREGALVIAEHLKASCIDPIIFVSSLKMVLMEEHPKINTFMLWGASNSGKSMIAHFIVRPFLYGSMKNQGSLGDYFYASALNKSVILFEEPFVTPPIVEDLKSLLAGASFHVGRKYTDMQLMNRTPVILTSNHYALGRGFVSPVDEQAIRNRCVVFNLGPPFISDNMLSQSSFVSFLRMYS